MSSPARIAPLAALIACSAGGAGPSAPVAPAADVKVASCARYTETAEVYQQCVLQAARFQSDAAEAERICASLGGALSAECREGWVTEQLAHPERLHGRADMLLAMCAGASDCGFVVLDHLPDPDPVAQEARCRQYAGRFAIDCAGHALQRWVTSHPLPEDQVRVAEALGGRWPEPTGFWIGLWLACGGEGECPSAPVMGDACVRSRAEARSEPGQCQRIRLP